MPADPASPALIAFTSGTTSNPKGVIHSHQTLGFETRQLLENYPPDRGRQLTATPVGHFIGMLGAFLIPVLEGRRSICATCGIRARVLELIESDGLSIGGGPPYFVTSLLDHPDCTPEHVRISRPSASAARRFPPRSPGGWPTWACSCSGPTAAPNTRRSPVRAAPRPRTSGSTPTATPGRAWRSGSGPDGEIFSRGPDLCLGYTDEELTAQAFDADGWYRTGDVGVLDDDGYLTITDRKADVIIRGGENISALEVEEVLLAMPAVAEAVVVAAPDDRLGERAAAVLRIREGHDMPTLDEVRDALQGGRRRDPEMAGGAARSRRLSRAPRAARCRSSWFGRTLRCSS